MAAVVADNGSGTCNTEFAGDDAPRVELPSIIDGPKMPGIMVDTWSAASLCGSCMALVHDESCKKKKKTCHT